VRRTTWLLLSILTALCVAALCWAGIVVGIVNGLTDNPGPATLNVTILHTTKRWDGGSIDTTKGVMSLEMEQTFSVDEAPQGKGLHILLAIPSICRNVDLSLSLGGAKLSPSQCSPPRLKALVDWLLAQKTARPIEPDQVRFMSVPLDTQLTAEAELSLKMTCRIRPTQDGDSLLFTVPQILHTLEPKPIGELTYQIDVGPAQSVSVPGYEGDTKIERNTPTDDWRRIHYSATNVPTAGLKEFIVRIVR
jgi:hypothetical protein